MINELKRLPIKELEQIGFKERDLIQNRNLLVNLLSGKRSELLPIQFKTFDGKVQEQKVKLSLSSILRNDQTYGLKIHPIKKEFEKAEHLNTVQFNKLKNGGTIIKDMVDKQGDMTKHILQKDKQTNELLKVSINDFNFPLNKEELKKIKNNEAIKVNGKEILVDLSSSKGYTDLELKNKQSQDKIIESQKNKEAIKPGTVFKMSQKSGDYVIQNVSTSGKVSYNSTKDPSKIMESSIEDLSKVMDLKSENNAEQKINRSAGVQI
tara:strand:- start:51889 stop:52683 length:795 start_codon:yes stop_codon:yes gene_type:complete